MKLPNFQKGSAQLLIIFAVLLVLIVGGVYLYPKIKGNNLVSVSEFSSPKKIDVQEYSNQALGFTFKYANELNVKEDTEEEFDKRGNGNFRKNFKGYVAYEPGKFLGAVVVLDEEQKYEINPFTLWVFDNPDDLIIDDWHHKYWYYPFVWGDFTAQGKFDLAPKEIATISGQIGKSGVIDYQPGKPKFVYVSKDQKMYLFRIIGETGNEILSTFQITSTEPNKITIPNPKGEPGTEEYCHAFNYKDCPTTCEVGPSCKFCQDIGCHAKKAHWGRCIEEESVRYKNSRYKEGEVLIGFQDKVTKDSAEQFLASLGYTFKTQNIRNSVVDGKVEVGVGKEIEVICQFKQSTLVRYAELNGLVYGNNY